mgnify:CR=1 FL=1
MRSKTNDTRAAHSINYVRGDESEQTERGAGGEGVRENCRRSGVARITPTGQ